MGDPTLRLHPVIPPSNLLINETTNGFNLTWNESAEADLLGYYVYKSDSDAGPFTRISGTNPISETNFTDSAGVASSVYMLRAVKLESSPSGTYYNLSQGIFVRPFPLPSAPGNFAGSATSTNATLSWKDNSTNESGFYIYRKSSPNGAAARIASLAANVVSFSDTNVTSGSNYIYTLSAYNAAGEAAAENEVNLTVSSSSAATFVGLDKDTGGSWKGRFGTDGYNVIQDSVSYPGYVNVLATGQNAWIWNYNTSDPAALQRTADNTRLAACWYSFSPFTIQLAFSDNATHRVSLYFLDWDVAGRVEKLEVIGSNGSPISQVITNFANGVYSTWDLQGNTTLRFTPVNGNAVLSGIFFDSPLPTAALPTLNPPGGKFTNSVQVAISSTDAGAEVRYTIDGSNPTTSSILYSSPVTLTNSATLKARAFKSGMNPSPIATGQYTIIVPTGPPAATVTFNGTNTTRQGTWKSTIGKQGFMVASDAQSIPNYLSLTSSGKSDWIWEYSTNDPRALQRQTDTTRMASCWYSSGAFDVNFNFKDNQPHRVSIYCLDWDHGGRTQTVEIIDAATDQVLHSYTLSNFANGIYLDYTITGPVIARFTRINSYNSVLSGIFFDTP